MGDGQAREREGELEKQGNQEAFVFPTPQQLADEMQAAPDVPKVTQRVKDVVRVLADFAKLRRYFAQRSILGAAGAAGLTVMLGAAAVLVVTQLLFGYAVPADAKEVLLTLGVSFALGCAMDVAIERLRVFSGLEPYYAAHGAGVWGGASLVVSMLVVLGALAYVLPLLK